MLEPLVEPSIVDALAHFVEVQLSGMHVSCVARVERFDADKQTVDCQPLVQHEYPNEYGDRALETLPIMNAVPVSFPRSAAGGLTFPLAPGDVVTVIATTRSITKWLRTAGANNPVDPEVDRHHTLSDGVAFPCIRRLSDAIGDFANATVLAGDDVRLGDASADQQVVVQSALKTFVLALQTAMTNMEPTGSAANPPGVITVSQIMTALGATVPSLDGSGWDAGTTKTKAT